jgi:hypothetical protein
VKVPDSEGLATHTGPESCVAIGNGRREALTGERAGRISSPEIGLLLGADALRTRGRRHWGYRKGKVSTDLAGSETPGMHGNPLCGTREALPLAWRSMARSARGTRQGDAREARGQGVGPLHSTEKACEQWLP